MYAFHRTWATLCFPDCAFIVAWTAEVCHSTTWASDHVYFFVAASLCNNWYGFHYIWASHGFTSILCIVNNALYSHPVLLGYICFTRFPNMTAMDATDAKTPANLTSPRPESNPRRPGLGSGKKLKKSFPRFGCWGIPKFSAEYPQFPRISISGHNSSRHLELSANGPPHQ